MISSDNSVLIPRPDDAVIVVEPAGPGRGFWAGAPSAVAADGGVYLAYRLRRPVGSGRGYAVAIAFAADGVHFGAPLKVIDKEELDTESLERPELVRLPGGGWRLYLSCATTGTKHWRVEVTDAAHPAAFDVTERAVMLPGDPRKRAVKDPVITSPRRPWHMWATIHPLADPDADRPDDHRVRHQPGRPRLDLAGHRAVRPAGRVGLPGHPGHRRAASAGPGDTR